MKRSFLMVFFACLTLSLMAGTAWVAQRGSKSSVEDLSVETYQIHNANQDALDRTERRHIVRVPDEYGQLVHITENNDGVNLWFDNEGVVRNVGVSRGKVLIRRGVLFFDESVPE
ncbi:MAG: hypothetical protein ABIJ96_16290 [Elusimicrobiota bacterium]